jgi:uncharacterized radical SAM protein YgiQ
MSNMTDRREGRIEQPCFLPMTREEMDRLGWESLDVLFVTGDAYVDHPAFGTTLLGRWLADHGYRVGLIAQPDRRNADAVTVMGRPRLFAGVTAGSLDSMLAHYTAFRKKRSDDAYTPGGQSGSRPNRAVIVYSNLLKQAFPGLPVILGGIEASLRRAVHYDFWSNAIRRSILLDAKADLLVYGMGERTVLEIVRRLADDPSDPLKHIPGTAMVGDQSDLSPDSKIVIWPSLEDIQADPKKLMAATLAMEKHVHQANHWAVQISAGRSLLYAPPAAPLTTGELDRLYNLDYTRKPHPSYRDPIPAATMLASSINTHRGCGGGCSFCSLALHQGRRVRSRSRESILAEAAKLASNPGVKGSISDVGGPSAGMWGASCTQTGICRRPSCLFPEICPFFSVDHRANLDLLRNIKAHPGVRHVRVASGLRYDLALQDPIALNELVAEFVGGQLKVAPEHMSGTVLSLMRKPPWKQFEAFMAFFDRASHKAGKKQYLVPYLMSAFPGTTDNDMKLLADWLKKKKWAPQQVQCFIPTPGTVATAMYFAGIDPAGRSIPVAVTDAARLRQHRLLIAGGVERKKKRRS